MIWDISYWIPGPSLALAPCPSQINWILPARPLTQQMCSSHCCCRYNIIHVQGDDYNLIYTSCSTEIQATTQSWNHGMVPSVCNCQGYVFHYIFCWRKGRIYNWVAIITVRACKISVRNHTLVCWRGDLHFILTHQNGSISKQCQSKWDEIQFLFQIL